MQVMRWKSSICEENIFLSYFRLKATFAGKLILYFLKRDTNVNYYPQLLVV